MRGKKKHVSKLLQKKRGKKRERKEQRGDVLPHTHGSPPENSE